MPRKPKPDEEPVDPDAFDDLDEDDLPDLLDLHDLEPVFTEEAPLVRLDEDEDDEELPLLPEDEALGVEAPLDLGDDEEDDGPVTRDVLLDDEVDWDAMLGDDEPGHDLPVLDWHQVVFVEELGRTLDAELDPTAESTTWFRPDVNRAAHRLTFALGGQTVSPFPSLVRSRTERLRIGRDVLAGRFLVRC